MQTGVTAPGTYARILFVDFSSAFNIIIPPLLQYKFSKLNLPDSTCRWITDFLSDRKQLDLDQQHRILPRLRPFSFAPNTEPPVISLSRSWSLRMTPTSLSSFLVVISQPTGRRLTIWWPGLQSEQLGVHSVQCIKAVKMVVDLEITQPPQAASRCWSSQSTQCNHSNSKV